MGWQVGSQWVPLTRTVSLNRNPFSIPENGVKIPSIEVGSNIKDMFGTHEAFEGFY